MLLTRCPLPGRRQRTQVEATKSCRLMLLGASVTAAAADIDPDPPLPSLFLSHGPVLNLGLLGNSHPFLSHGSSST